VVSLDPACASVVAALEDDPFYRAICGASLRDATRRRAALTQYFAYLTQYFAYSIHAFSWNSLLAEVVCTDDKPDGEDCERNPGCEGGRIVANTEGQHKIESQGHQELAASLYRCESGNEPHEIEDLKDRTH
jgi:hypothetical protein